MTEVAANPSGAEPIVVTDVDSATQALLARDELRSTPAEPEAVADDAVEEEEVVEVEENDDSEQESDESDDSSDEREAESEEEVDPQFHSVNELAEALELSPEDFESQINVTVKVDGEEKEVNLAELRKGYQLESDYRQKTMKLADEKREFEGETEQAKQALTTRLTEATNLVANMEKSILSEYSDVNWQELRTTNPAEYAALQSDYQNRYQGVQQLKGQTDQASSQLQSEQTAQQEQAAQAHLQKESAALLDVLPEWKDSSVATKEQSQMRDFLKGYNFNDDEISKLADHRIVLMIRDAQKGKTITTKTAVALKKISKAPKLQKAGNKQSKQTIQSQKFNDLKTNLKKTGHVDDVARLLMARSK